MCLKVDRATRCNCSWMADGREKSLRRRATSRRTRRRLPAVRPGGADRQRDRRGAHTCAARPPAEPLPSYYCTGHICAQSVRARHAQAHRWVFRFPFRFFFSSLKSEYLKLTNNRFWLKYCCLIATKFFL